MHVIDISFLNKELEASMKDYPSFVESGTFLMLNLILTSYIPLRSRKNSMRKFNESIGEIRLHFC